MNTKRRIAILWFFAGFLLFNLSAQDSKEIDSLKNVLKNGNLEQKLEALARLEDKYESIDPKKAREFAVQQLNLATKHNDNKWKSSAYNSLGAICFMKGAMDSAEYYFNQSLQVAKDAKIQRSVQIARVNLSSVQRTTYKFDEAMENLQLVLDYFEKERDNNKIALTLSNIAATYGEMGNYERHNEYALKALAICEKIGDKRQMGILLANLCTVTSRQKQWKQSIQYGEKAVKIFSEINDQYMIGLSKAKLVDAMLKSGKLDSITSYTNEIVTIAEKLDVLPLKGEALNLQANYLLMTKKYPEAKEMAFKAVALVDTTEKTNLGMLYETLTTTSIRTNDTENAIKFFLKYKDNLEKITTEEWKSKIAEMEFKYQTEKKELKIKGLEKERILYSIIFIAGVIVLLFFLRILFLRNRNNKTLKQLAEQKISQLEQEKQLVATQAILDGENAERTRLAHDLHDGLGGMLSAVKLNLFDMKRDVVLETEEVTRFNKVLEMLDNSIQELRRVAHNMMPESLSRYGLKIALEDFCNSFSNVKFHFFGMDQRFEKTLETTVYRAIHELVNNAVKHSQAKTINVQLITQENKISIIVQDDGIGFNSDENFAGRGLQNIQNRVNAVGGTMNIFSSADKGTEISININIS